MSLTPEIASMEKSQIRSGDSCGPSGIASQLWNVNEMRSLCKPTMSVPSEFGELTLADDSAPVQPLNKIMTEVPTENVHSAKTSKGGKIGEDKDWNKDYGTNQTNLGMPNATDKGTVNMQVNSAGTVRDYQWGHEAPNVDGTVRDRRVDVDKYNNSHVGLRAHAQKLELPADDANKSVHAKILKNSN